MQYVRNWRFRRITKYNTLVGYVLGLTAPLSRFGTGTVVAYASFIPISMRYTLHSHLIPTHTHKIKVRTIKLINFSYKISSPYYLPFWGHQDDPNAIPFRIQSSIEVHGPERIIFSILNVSVKDLFIRKIHHGRLVTW